MTAGEPSVLVMAKAPRPGHAKTRLQPALGAPGCATLQAALIRHTGRVADQAARVFVAVTPDDAGPEVAELLPPRAVVLGQGEGHLGQRMTAAVAAVHDATGGPVVVIGTDAPTLTAQRIAEAATVAPGETVLGPALDGGYYLAALNRPAPEVFGIAPALWSGPDVLGATVVAAEGAGLTVRLLGALRDLDTPEDASALLADPALPAEIAGLLDVGAVLR